MHVSIHIHVYLYTHGAKAKQALTFSPASRPPHKEPRLSSAVVLHTCANRNTKRELQPQNNTLVSPVALHSFCRDANTFINNIF